MNPQSLPRPTRRYAVLFSLVSAVSLLLGALLLWWFLDVIREFEPDDQFRAHNNIHWFRPIAFFWFHRFSVLPSICLATLIFARHFLPESFGLLPWFLGLVTAFLLAVGAFTVWEHTAFIHQFSL